MKRRIAALTSLFLMPFVAIAASVPADTVVETNAGLFQIIAQIISGAQGGDWLLVVSAVLVILLSLLKNTKKIPILQAIKAYKLVEMIPKAYFALVITAVMVGLAIVGSLATGGNLKIALLAGLKVGLTSAGLNEVLKRTWRGINGAKLNS